jgi:hypothetical protein
MDDRVRSRGAPILLAGMIAGLLTAIAGGAWMAAADPSDAWSPEKAAEHKAAGEALHAARRGAHGDQQSGAPSHEPDGGNRKPPDLSAAQARFERIEAELAEARTRRQRAATWLVRTGLAAMVLFGIGYLATRPA